MIKIIIIAIRNTWKIACRIHFLCNKFCKMKDSAAVQIFLGHEHEEWYLCSHDPSEALMSHPQSGDPEELLNLQRVIGTTTAITPSRAKPSERPINFPYSKHLVLLSNPAKAPSCCANFMNLSKSVRRQPRNCNQQTCWGLGFTLDFSGVLLKGSALIPMVQIPKELALLGGSFLVGLGALEVCLRIGGFWHNNHLDNRSISNGQERKGLSFSAGTHQLPWPF